MKIKQRMYAYWIFATFRFGSTEHKTHNRAKTNIKSKVTALMRTISDIISQSLNEVEPAMVCVSQTISPTTSLFNAATRLHTEAVEIVA